MCDEVTIFKTIQDSRAPEILSLKWKEKSIAVAVMWITHFPENGGDFALVFCQWEFGRHFTFKSYHLKEENDTF